VWTSPFGIFSVQVKNGVVGIRRSGTGSWRLPNVPTTPTALGGGIHGSPYTNVTSLNA